MAKALISLGRFLWRIWFYILVTLPILVFGPLLLLFTLSERTYAQFFWLARNIWALFILIGMGCIPYIRRDERMQRGKSYMLIANHTSMLDIMLMLRASRHPFVFVGKKELVKIPIFGFFYKRVCIMVDREDPRSRSAVYRRVKKRLAGGLNICIFPEGGVPEESLILDRFKDGAFKMAIAHQIPIVPMSFYDCKKRFPFRWSGGAPGPLRVRVHQFITTAEMQDTEASKLKEQAWQLLYNSLSSKIH